MKDFFDRMRRMSGQPSGQTANIASGHGKTFSFDHLLELMDIAAAIPPPPFLASSKAFPKDRVLSFEFEGRTYAGAHPDVWAKLPQSRTVSEPPFLVQGVADIRGITIVDIDVDAIRAHDFFAAMSGKIGTL